LVPRERGDTSRSAASRNDGISAAGRSRKQRHRVDTDAARLRAGLRDLIRLAARQHETCVWPGARDDGHRLEEQIEPLVRFKRAGVQDDRRVLADAERTPHARGLRGGGRGIRGAGRVFNEHDLRWDRRRAPSPPETDR
jgi:hypothetical protein